MKANKTVEQAEASHEQAPPAVVRQGFRHPRADAGATPQERGRVRPADISERACTWDA